MFSPAVEFNGLSFDPAFAGLMHDGSNIAGGGGESKAEEYLNS